MENNLYVNNFCGNRQTVMAPNIHLAASLAAEAGSVARLVAMNAMIRRQEERQSPQERMTNHQEVLSTRPSISVSASTSSGETFDEVSRARSTLL